MKILKFKFLAAVLFVISAIQVGFVSCSDDPGVENYYTASKEYAADFLRNRDQFSDYLTILQRATGERGDLRLVDLLGTYGSYTVFAPTNDAIAKYLKGIGKNSIDELSKEDCDTIALNSIIELAYFTTDCSDGQYSKSNMLEHVMSVQSKAEWSEAKQDSVLAMYINRTALIQHADDSVSNGVVHTMASVVNSSNNLVGTSLIEDSLCTYYAEAFQKTGWIDSLQNYVDDTYKWATDQDRIDSCTWTNNKLCIHTAAEYDNVAYPEKRYFNYTVFMCPDTILQQKYNIHGVDDLYNLAKELYQPVYDDPEDIAANEGNNAKIYTNPRNYLNRFIAYHILNRWGEYYTLTYNDNFKLPYNFRRNKKDIADWYETMMPHSLMKFSFPSGSQAGLYINRRGVQSRADARGMFVRGAKITPPKQMILKEGQQQTAVNGIYHHIDDVVAYDKQTQEVVMDECIRFDCTTLSPDFMTKLTDGETARGHSAINPGGDNNRYGKGGQGTNALTNSDHGVGFKSGYTRNFTFKPTTHIHVRGRVLNYWSYEADELTVKGKYDVVIKLPPVPAGTYEIRMMTCTGFESRGIVQAYIDDIPQGIPFDMRPGGGTLFGNGEKLDQNKFGNDEEAIAAWDKSIHNLGWMQGPKFYMPGNRSSSDYTAASMRDLPNTIRKVLGTFTTTGKEDHYLRMQQKMDSEDNEMNFDFIELCPSSVYNNEYFAEEPW